MRFQNGRKEYIITDGKGDYPFSSDSSLYIGSSVIIEGELQDGQINTNTVTILNDKQAKQNYVEVKGIALAEARNSIEKHTSGPSILHNQITVVIWPDLVWAATEILAAKRLGRSILIRFHGDADGISSAFAISSVCYSKPFQQNSAVYSIKDALRDISLVGQENRPLVLLLDFGSNQASNEGLKLLESADVEYLIVDHHPYTMTDENVDKRIVSPYKRYDKLDKENIDRRELSKYTAGYLSCEISIACGFGKEKALELARVACAGDKSDIVQIDNSDKDKAMVLDFLAAHASFGNNLEFYKSVMNKRELFSSIVHQANESIEETAKRVLLRAKKSLVRAKDGSELIVTVFSLDGIVRKDEWPSSGKVTTYIYEKLDQSDRRDHFGNKENGHMEVSLKSQAVELNKRPLVCIGYNERSIIIRMNSDAASMGIGADAIAELVKVPMADFVEGGGGHANAGAIRVREGFVKDVLAEIIRVIERIASD